MYSEKNGNRPDVHARPGRHIPWAAGSLAIGIISVPLFVILGAIWLIPFGIGAGHIGLNQARAQGGLAIRSAYAGIALSYVIAVLALVEALMFYFLPGFFPRA